MIKKALKWIAKRYVTVNSVKDAVHGMNARFADKVKLEGKQHVMDVANDVSTCIQTRTSGYADDGKIDDVELAKINANDDRVIVKYLTEERIKEILDLIFG